MSRFRRQPWLEAVLLVLLFLVALAIRLYGLHKWPPGLYNDEAANGLDAIGVLGGRRPIFFESNNGREPLFIYLQAVSMALFGATPYALRLTAAVVGALTVPAIYWMTREAFARTTLPARWLALWTALFLAFSYWHISLSRIGFRAIMLPLMAALAFGWFWRAWWKLDHPNNGQDVGRYGLPLLDLVLCGLFVGLSMYTYTAARFLPMVIAVVAIAGAVFTYSPQRTRRIGLGMGVIAVTAILVFTPLGIYYLSHPGAFAGRATSISIFSPEFAVGGPIVSLARSTLDLVKMFFIMPDPNLRHNPAERPVFDLLMAGWLAIGLLIAAIRWRGLPYFFTLTWILFLSLPAVLTAEGVPHSLRAIGILPVATLFAVLGMLVVGERVLKHRKSFARWLPLPFLLFSGYVGLRDYFQSWQNTDRFREAFQTDLMDLGKLMAVESSPNTVWILPISPNYDVPDAQFYNVGFFARDRFGWVLVDEQKAAEQLATATKGSEYANLVRSQYTTGDRAALTYVFGDPKHLLDFLLRKHGRFVAAVEKTGDALSYASYELPTKHDYRVAANFEPMDVSFNNEVRLTEVAFGRTAQTLEEDADALENKTLASGDSLWAVLHWVALAPIEVDLKASLVLKDGFGNIAGQVDDLLVSDGYPLLRKWWLGATTGTYHIVPTLPAIPPGQYGLYLKVYEDRTGRPYPVMDQYGIGQGMEALLGYVDVTPLVNPPAVSPQTSMPSKTRMGPDLDLLGYDLPVRDVRPGDSLPLTLYWQASKQPSRDYRVRVELRDPTGKPVVTQEMSPANDTYPTSQWQTDEIVRDWHRIPITTSLAGGVYDLAVVVTDGGQALAEANLGQVTVKSRPRLMEPPPLSSPLSAVFGERVALLGVVAPDEIKVAPGDTITLTVAWQALATPTEDLVRFVHMLGPDGRPASQSDGVPCNGDCVSALWLPGEILVDEIRVQIPVDLPSGSYPIGVGWYDSATLQRLPARDANGQPLADNLVILPLTVDVGKP